jgi:hypothetical protein
MRYMLRRLLPLVLVALAAIDAGAQQTQHDSKGTEFWVSFLENYGSAGDGEISDLRLYAACDKPTKIYLRYNRTGEVREVRITEADLPTEIHVQTLFGYDLELVTGEEFSRKSITVTSDEEITLYGVNVRTMSADAFLSLPDDILTGRYVVLAYQNGFTDFQGFKEIDMASQFCVIATEDGTLVNVTPSAPIRGKSAQPFMVALDEGDVYFAQAELTGPWDVSGTILQATKPIAVYAGNRRTSIPSYIGNFRDHLVEQMPPIEVWGKEAIVTPHYPISPESDEIAVIRILSAADNTSWALDGVPQADLMRAMPVELPLTRAMHIVADRPIIVAQYEHSVNVEDSMDFGLGDPFMMLVPPPEQFDTAYAFQSVAHSEFLRHFVNIVIPAGGVASLRLDGQPIVGRFVPIVGTGFGYMQYELSAGAHRIRSDSSFGLFAYGYGRANSYGYTGGMAYRTFIHDFEPPDLAQILSCGRIDGVVTDDEVTDTGIDSCMVGPQTTNMAVTIDGFERAPDSVFFSATLVDPYSDGVFAIRAVDSVGRSRTQVTPVPGFTVRIVGAPANGTITLDTLALFNGSVGCRQFELVNDGKYPQTVSTLRLEPDISAIPLSAQLPITLAPGMRRMVEFCVSTKLDTQTSVAVLIGAGCIDRTVALVTISSGIDTLGPSLSLTGDGCGTERTYRFTEPERGSGIVGIDFTELTNARRASADEPFTAPAKEAERRIVVIDPRRDAFIAGSVVDNVGNRVFFRDTIAGFTCAVLDEDGDTVSLALGRDLRADRIALGDERCDSVTITNYGLRPLTITTARMSSNLSASVPPSQLPMTLAPGEQRRLAICLDGRETGLLDDTLTIYDDCGRYEAIALRAAVQGLSAGGGDRCNSALSVQSIGPSKRTFLATPVPNPSAGPITIDVGLAADDAITLELVDANGRAAYAIMRAEPLRGGLHRIVADLSDLESGRYYVRLTGTTGSDAQAVVVVR